MIIYFFYVTIPKHKQNGFNMSINLKLSSIEDMSQIYKNRLSKLRDLMEEKNIKTLKILSEKLGVKPAVVSRMFATSTLPEKYCRHIERCLDKPLFWLDQEQLSIIKKVPGYFFDSYRKKPDSDPLFFIDKIAKDDSFCIKIAKEIGSLTAGSYLTFEPTKKIQDLKPDDIVLLRDTQKNNIEISRFTGFEFNFNKEKFSVEHSEIIARCVAIEY